MFGVSIRHQMITLSKVTSDLSFIVLVILQKSRGLGQLELCEMSKHGPSGLVLTVVSLLLTLLSMKVVLQVRR